MIEVARFSVCHCLSGAFEWALQHSNSAVSLPRLLSGHLHNGMMSGANTRIRHFDRQKHKLTARGTLLRGKGNADLDPLAVTYPSLAIEIR